MALYYLTFGTYPGFEDYHLHFSPAGDQKAKYIFSLLDGIQEEFTAISLSRTANRSLKWFPRRSRPCGRNGRFVVWGVFGRPSRLFAALQQIVRKAQLYAFLNSLSPRDTVIVYHSLFNAGIVAKTKARRGYRLILELEEIYQDVVPCTEAEKAKEKRVVEAADGYILATSLLSARIGKGKPFVIVNGDYSSYPVFGESFGDGRIHCVYAGTFDPTKGGAAAVECAAYLPDNYHVHILGFGRPEQTEELLEKIKRVNARGGCTLSYDGLKSGEAFLRFLQKCQIGLCTQTPDAQYASSSFPSKILVYLANGLRVLSVRIPAVEQSEVGDLLFYYDEQSPQAIARAITEIDMSGAFDGRSRLIRLDGKARQGLKELIRSMGNARTGEVKGQR